MARAKKEKTQEQKPFEQMLWQAADKLRKNIDAAEYKHYVLGLLFLKYVSDAFEELHQTILNKEGEHAYDDPEDKLVYSSQYVFFVPPHARWSHLVSRAKLPTIGEDVDNAMDLIEKENPKLRGVLPKQFGRPQLDKMVLGELIDLINNINLGDEAARKKDLLGVVYEYFLGQFALAEGRKGGQFYTPRSVVQLLVEMLQPDHGKVYDPCCGSGGMFVMSEKFVLQHQGRIDDITIYGQESNQTTWRLAVMNLAIRGIDPEQVKWNAEGSFLKDAHPDLKADFIIANPPFNISDWSGELLRNDGRWKYGVPPTGNANYGWLQHMLYHLSPTGKAGVVLSKGALTTKSGGEYEIRKNMIEAGVIDCIVNLPTKLFLNTQIPACLWFLNRDENRKRKGQILFIDARNLGHLINRRTREFTDTDIQRIADTYHHWLNEREYYEDIPGFCMSSSLRDVTQMDYVLTPGRYIGLPDDEDDFNFDEKFSELKRSLEFEIKKEYELNDRILRNLSLLKPYSNG
ncbi:type I restriction-modification system subunit M [Flaviaesturariibacter aridisoli]|uniref:site-specific DNA-methyltransferase (adenine-specific) n=1 Tax=Flaviaesturariibacter aridisoli TaxID=2545761 RepID=A0A4R4E1I0_9BACT|nr:class I SAM-dependent DNA methyltransferase [Flaviaesturariibacter aridisoli]TCZ73276.1 SAM-dependent DNA methyltransferase [Flaviaesturariibacter aridisoli]